MTVPELRLAELDRVARKRPLTDAEQREVMLRAKQFRRNAVRRRRYWLDADYRARRKAQARP